MAEVVVYTKDYCPHCTRAKMLLKRKGQTFREINVTRDTQLQQEMVEKSGGRRSVPQILINGQAIGGADELYALESAGKLDSLLAG